MDSFVSVLECYLKVENIPLQPLGLTLLLQADSFKEVLSSVRLCSRLQS